MLIHTDYKLTDDITLTNLVKLITALQKLMVSLIHKYF